MEAAEVQSEETLPAAPALLYIVPGTMYMNAINAINAINVISACLQNIKPHFVCFVW